MDCPHCTQANNADVSVCTFCGEPLLRCCPNCAQENSPRNRHCRACGHGIEIRPQTPARNLRLVSTTPPTETSADTSSAGGDRRHVSILIAEISDHVSLCERMDPATIQKITALVFEAAAQAVKTNAGGVDEVTGGTIRAVFDANRRHRENPIRAIAAAREINRRITALDVAEPLTMQIGISTGAAGGRAPDQGARRISGEMRDTASRLSRMSAAGEVLVGPDTFLYAQAHFEFELLTTTDAAEDATGFPAYRVVGPREAPRKAQPPYGMRSRIIGRQRDLERLHAAVRHADQGEGCVVTISGAAGTGKSRLIEEFKASIDTNAIQWLEGHAYPSARNIPYAPLIDLVGTACGIEEKDAPENVQRKIDTGLANIAGPQGKARTYIGSLFDLHYDELSHTSPETWKSHLHQAVLAMIERLARQKPTIICIEDLHWADSSFVDLMQHVVGREFMPVVFICSYRPTFSLVDKSGILPRPGRLIEIELHDLPPDHSVEMLLSLLDTPAVPNELLRLVKEKAEGNPFYLEEVINAMIENKTLTRSHSRWQISGSMGASAFCPTIHGVVSGRLDHLETPTRRLLQEAAVIGRVFPYDILKQIADGEAQLDQRLRVLEHLDMIRSREDQGQKKYMFKHALVQEVAYSGILKNDRRGIHEKIALKIESMFADRLSPYYETLAFHFTMGQSTEKAVDYLMKSGAKSMQRHSVEEAHRHFQQAYDMLRNMGGDPRKRASLLVDVLIQWFYVFNVRGIFNAMITLLKRHEQEAIAIGDKSRLAMYYCCMGWALQRREQLKPSYGYLLKAKALAQACGDHMMGAYAAACRIWTCTDLGRLDEAVEYGLQARALLEKLRPDQELVRINLTGLGVAYWFRGESGKCREIGEALLEYGDHSTDIRSTSDGYLVCGMSRFVAGDYEGAIAFCQKAIGASVGLVHSFNSKFLLGYAYLSSGQIQAAEKVLAEIIQFASRSGYEYLGTAAEALSGMIALAKGRLRAGFETIRDQMQAFHDGGKRYHYLTFEYLLGRIHLQIALREGELSFGKICRNLVFLIQHAPRAGRRAEQHFLKTIPLAAAIGARAIEAQAHYDLGRLYGHRKRYAQARQHLAQGIELLEACEADSLLAEARRFARSLPSP